MQSYDTPDMASTIAMLQRQVEMLQHQLNSAQGGGCAALNIAQAAARRQSYDNYEPIESHRKRKLTKDDFDGLPHRLIIVRHAESQGNVDHTTYSTQADHSVKLTEYGRTHARGVGAQLREYLDNAYGGPEHKVFFMTSPYTRTLETTDALLESFSDEQVVGVRQAVQLREQDFGNFQDPARIKEDMSDRQKFGRFWFRFPNGESGADVYDRLTIFEDHLTRDMLMGRFADTSLVLVSHGLTMRIFLMRWFHWSVDEFMEVYNPDNCDPIILERLPWSQVQDLQGKKYAHAKHCYAITPQSRSRLRGLHPGMCSYLPRRYEVRPKTKWLQRRQCDMGSAPAPFSGSMTETLVLSDDEAELSSSEYFSWHGSSIGF